MKQLITILSIIVCIIVFNQNAAIALCPEKIIGYWQLDEGDPLANGFLDTSGSGNDAACTVCPTYTTAGMIQQAQIFDGAATGVDVPDNTAFNWNVGDSFSIEFWVKVSPAHTSESVVIGRTSTTTSLEWHVGINSQGQAIASLIASDGSGSSGALSGSDDLKDDLWHHVVLVRDEDSNENRLHVDGKLVDSVSITYTAGFNASPSKITIGWLNKGDGFYFSGTIDEVAIYRNPLLDDTILQHYRDGSLGLQLGYCSGDDPVKIMPLGDSITRGSYGSGTSGADMVGFRRSLYLDLEDVDQNGLDDYLIDFVGSAEDGQSANDFDLDHEGHSGITAAGIESLVLGYLGSNPADVVLLHIGTNDISEGASYSTVVSDVNAILEKVDQYDPAIPVVLARIINRKDPLSTEFQKTSDFNAALQTMAETRIASGDRLLVVDQESALTPDDIVDEVHPNLGGYGKMANVWYAGLVTFLPPTKFAVPGITSTAFERANLNSLYSYDVEANGNEPPVFALSDPSPLPGDMDIDPVAGTITWTPTSDSPVDVVVEATNSHGTDTQSFRITVGNSPAAVNDAYGPGEQAHRLEIDAPVGVLINDTDSDLDQLQAVLFSDVSRGTLTLAADGSFTYVHDGSDITSDSFSYRAHDGAGYSNAATVNLIVRPNTAPEIVGQGNIETPQNTPVSLSPLSLVVNDPDNDYPKDFTITVYEGSNYTVNNSTITPSPGMEGTLSVPISVNDGWDESNIYSLKIAVKGNSGGGSSGCFIGSLEMGSTAADQPNANTWKITLLLALGMAILFTNMMQRSKSI